MINSDKKLFIRLSYDLNDYSMKNQTRLTLVETLDWFFSMKKAGALILSLCGDSFVLVLENRYYYIYIERLI